MGFSVHPARSVSQLLEQAHLIPFWLSLVAYGVEAGFRLLGVPAGRSPFKTPLFVGLLLHTIFLAWRWVLAAHAPMAGLFESLTVLAWCSAATGVLLLRVDGSEERGITWAWVPLSVLVLLPQIAAGFMAKGVRPLFPALDTPWFATHVFLSFLGYGFFATGLAAAWAFLRTGDDRGWRIAGNAALYGFSAFSGGMVAGGIWAFDAWGSYWIWTPKEIFSVILWTYYAALCHLKYIPATDRFPHWTRRVEAGATIVGYGVMLLTFLGVSLLMRSSHSF